MHAKIIKVKKSSHDSSFKQQKKKNLFPQIYSSKDLIENKNLNPVKFLSQSLKKKCSVDKISIPFQVIVQESIVDVFLFLNGIKSDMYYSVPSGSYSFVIYPNRGKNRVEIYYLLYGHKSPSVYRTFFKS